MAQVFALAPRRTGPSPAVSRLRNANESLQRRLSSMRKNTAGKSGAVVPVAAMALAAAAAPVAEKFVGPMLPIDFKWVKGGIGLVGVGIATFGMKHSTASTAVLFASGYWLASAIEDTVSDFMA